MGKTKISLEEIKSNLEDTPQFKLEPLISLIRLTGLSKNPELATLHLENQIFKLNLDRKETDETPACFAKIIHEKKDGCRQYSHDRP